MLVFSWNCRGLRNALTVSSLKSFLRATRAHIGFISETKCDTQYSELILNRLGYQNYVIIPAEGLSGGLWCFWDQDINILIISSAKNLIYVRINATQSEPDWELLCFYGPPAQVNKNQFWSDMSSLKSAITIPFLCIGDFKSITCQSEKRGGSSFSASTARAFKTWIAESGLLDLGYVGPAFTWENGQVLDHNIAERLDRALGNDSWCLNFPRAGVMHLPRYNSDHNPILLKTSMDLIRHPPPPRFEAMWLQNQNFKETLQEFWRARSSQSTLPNRLKFVLRDLKKWGRSTFGAICTQLKETEDKLLENQSRPISAENLAEGKSLQSRIIELQRLQEFFWRQRSRINWISTGDKNTKFFHLGALNRKRKNHIASLKLPNGNWIHQYDDISSTLVQHFSLASQATPASPIPPDILNSLPKVTERENELLFEIPSAEEIVTAIHAIGAGKAPGPDGLPALFYHNCWDVVRDEVIQLVQNFFDSSCLPSSLNHTFLVLIPKKKEACTPMDFRPISLCNVLYKLITKIITLRLRSYLDRLISPCQTAFVPGRQINDNLIIAQELIHSMTSANNFNSSFALKLDMATAYDRVSWLFLSQVLPGFGFIGRSHYLIMSCVNSATFSVLVNGAPQGFFAAERGLRQGCPLSPYLFILCSEILSQITLNAERNNLYTGFQINRRAPSISHLLFADDLFFFGKATIQNVLGVKKILQQYEELSGQMVNFEKSCLHTSPKLDPAMRQILLDIPGVGVMAKNDKYLGRQILLPSSRLATFYPLLDRCTKKLAAWKSNSLSHAGRTVLLKSSLTSIPIYTMGTTLLPKRVTQKLTQLQRQFWWGSTKDRKKQCLIGWNKVGAPKKLGGLGIRDPELVNSSLVAKLVWRFLTSTNSMWCQLLRANYLTNTGFWDTGKPHNGSHIWNGMLKCREVLKPRCCWEVGDGSRISIWDDPWISTLPGYRPTGKEDSHHLATKVCELLVSNSATWNIQLLDQLFEAHEVQAILRLNFNTSREDTLIWMPINSGEFSAKSMYTQLASMQPTNSSVSLIATRFNWSKLWKIRGVAPRIIMFLWRALHNGLAVGAILRRSMGVSGTCSLCNSMLETIDHALLHCSYATTVWMSSAVPIPRRFNQMTLAQFFTSLMENGLESFRKGCAILWALWKARNHKVFTSNSIPTVEILKQAEVFYLDYNSTPNSFMDTLDDDHVVPPNIPLHWELPPENFIKINVDGACSNGRIAAGIVGHDHEGNFIGCATKATDYGTPIEAEMQAVLLAFDLISQLQLQQVIIEGDTKLIVNWLNNHELRSDWRISQAILQGRAFLSSRPDVTISFSPRSTNGAAHSVAAFAITHGVTNCWVGGLPPLSF